MVMNTIPLQFANSVNLFKGRITCYTCAVSLNDNIMFSCASYNSVRQGRLRMASGKWHLQQEFSCHIIRDPTTWGRQEDESCSCDTSWSRLALMEKGTFTHTWTLGWRWWWCCSIKNFLVPPQPVACRHPTAVDATRHRPLSLKRWEPTQRYSCSVSYNTGYVHSGYTFSRLWLWATCVK
jgi:hypothetical protein